MSDAAWNAVPQIIAAVAGALILCYKEWWGTAELKKNTDLTKVGVDATARVGDRMDGVLAEARILAADRLATSEARLAAVEEELKAADARIVALLLSHTQEPPKGVKSPSG